MQASRTSVVASLVPLVWFLVWSLEVVVDARGITE